MKADAVGQTPPLIAACGLDCGNCLIQKAANDRAFAEKLAAEWRQSGRPQATADWFRCQGCHGPEDLIWTRDCKMRSCCIKTKKLANCSQCGEFPCSLIDQFEHDGQSRHAKAVRYLKELRKPTSAS